MSIARMLVLSLFTIALVACSNGGEHTKKAENHANNFQNKVFFFYGLGAKFDHSFNESAYGGLNRFRAKYPNFKVKSYSVSSETSLLNFYNVAIRDKARFIIGLSADSESPIQMLHKQYPQVNFAIIDAKVSGKNVTSILFRSEQSAFLAGIIAAMKTKTNIVSAIGGMPLPTVQNLYCGFKQGVKYINTLKGKHIKVIYNIVSSTTSGFTNPSKGAEIANSQFSQGSDVVFPIAGLTSIGVLKAAKEKKKYAIGVDSNQDGLYPGTILTSVIKRVDVALFSLLNDFKQGKLKSGVKYLGLSNNGVAITFDKYNKPLLNKSIVNEVTKAKSKIMDGTLVVQTYYDDPKCVR